MWTVAKRRRVADSFPGASVVLSHIKDKASVTRKRVGLRSKVSFIDSLNIVFVVIFKNTGKRNYRAVDFSGLNFH